MKKKKKKDKTNFTPKVGEVWKFPGYSSKTSKESGNYFILCIERVTAKRFYGTVLYTKEDNWTETSTIGVGNFSSTSRYTDTGHLRTSFSYVCESKEAFFDKEPHLIPVKEVVKEIQIKEYVDRPIRVISYHETWIDWLYNWYCNRKARYQDEIV